MPIDRERQKLVKAGVESIKSYEKNHPMVLFDSDDPVRPETLAEGLALLAAEARHTGLDEALAAEIVLRCCDFSRETLAEARRVLAALGYAEIVAVLKRLERSAPRRLTFGERMRIRAQRLERVN